MSNAPIIRAVRLNAGHTQEVAEAIVFLHQFLATEQRPIDSESPQSSEKTLHFKAEKNQIYDALTIVLDESESQNLGICAESHREGMLALQQYLAAFGEEVQPTCADPGRPLYIKYNGKTQGCYSEAYDGSHRGVIVSCYSSYDNGVNETFGHFPLNLFAT